LDQPGSVLAEAVSDVNHVAQLNEALRLAESDKRSASAELKIRLSDQVGFEASVKRYVGLDAVDALVAAIEVDSTKTLKIGGVLQAVRTLKDRWVGVLRSVSELEGIETIDVPVDDAFKAPRSLLGSMDVLNQLHRRYLTTQESVSKLQGIESIHVPDVADPIALLDDLETYIKLQDQLARAKVAVSKLDALPDIGDLDISDVDGIWDNLKSMLDLRDQLDAARALASSIQDDATTNEELYLGTIHDIGDTLGGLGECPTCGSVHMGGHS
jgi:hypothetical protein